LENLIKEDPDLQNEGLVLRNKELSLIDEKVDLQDEESALINEDLVLIDKNLSPIKEELARILDRIQRTKLGDRSKKTTIGSSKIVSPAIANENKSTNNIRKTKF